MGRSNGGMKEHGERWLNISLGINQSFAGRGQKLRGFYVSSFVY